MENIMVSVFMVLGALFILISSIGMVRFNDFYSRIHASTKATSFGVLLVLISVAFYFESWNVTIKALMVIIYVYLTAPLSAHSIAKSFNDKSKEKRN